MDSKKSLKAKPVKTVKKSGATANKPVNPTKKFIADTDKAQAKKKGSAAAAKNFLFSIPSQHTTDDDFEHLVVAPTKEDACRLLAEHRVTEKQPDLSSDQRAVVVQYATNGYNARSVKQIEPRKEAAGVLAVNHPKLAAAQLH